MTEFSKLVTLLKEACAEPALLPSLIPKFQELVWNSKISYPNEAAEEALNDLSYDLEYYASDPKKRAGESLFFGEERAIREIRSTLAILEENKDEE